MEFHNGVCMHKDKHKPGRSGMSCNEAFSQTCLLSVDIDVIQEIKAVIGGVPYWTLLPLSLQPNAKRHTTLWG